MLIVSEQNFDVIQNNENPPSVAFEKKKQSYFAIFDIISALFVDYLWPVNVLLSRIKFPRLNIKNKKLFFAKDKSFRNPVFAQKVSDISVVITRINVSYTDL